MAHRKTVAVLDLLATLNERTRLCPDRDGRVALCFLTEKLLMDANVYAGYGYVHADGSMVSAEEVNAEGWTDDYRHFYYTSVRLTRTRQPAVKAADSGSNPWPLK